MKTKEVWDLGIRYGLLVIFGIFLEIFYLIFRPLTIYPVYFILNLVYGASVFENSIILFGERVFSIQIIDACVAGAAYYLLLILNLSVSFNLKRRIKSLLFLFSSFLVLNIIRIVIFSVLFVSGFEYFDLAHRTVWYAGSTVIVIVIWFVNVKMFKIREIPVYNDFRRILRDIKKDILYL